MAIAPSEFLSKIGVNMENTEQKPASDLERIQQSYTSGTQVYVPRREKSPIQVTRPEAQTTPTRGRIRSLASQA